MIFGRHGVNSIFTNLGINTKYLNKRFGIILISNVDFKVIEHTWLQQDANGKIITQVKDIVNVMYFTTGSVPQYGIDIISIN